MSYLKAEEKARRFERRAELIREKAKAKRKLPDYWRVGQLVRMLHDQEWAWSRGDIMRVSGVRDPNTPAKDTLSFTVSPRGKNPFGNFYCTPDDVELYRDTPEKKNGN